MGFFGRMLGIEDEADRRRAAQPPMRPAASAPDSEARALERYRYMLRTAPPETLEQAHAEAFAQLSPEQRRQILSELARNTPPSEHASVAATPPDDPRALARVATRAELREPGVLERSLGSGAMGLGASLLGSFAMGFVGSMVAQSYFSALEGFGTDAAGDDRGADGSRASHEVDEGGDLANDTSQDDPYMEDGDFGDDYEV